MQQNFLFSGDDTRDWRLDEHTKTIGKRGVAAARATLEACRSEAGDQALSAAA